MTQMTQKLQEVFGGRSPISLATTVDVTEALIFGLDCRGYWNWCWKGDTVRAPFGLGHIPGEHPRNRFSGMSIDCLDPLGCGDTLF